MCVVCRLCVIVVRYLLFVWCCVSLLLRCVVVGCRCALCVDCCRCFVFVVGRRLLGDVVVCCGWRFCAFVVAGACECSLVLSFVFVVVCSWWLFVLCFVPYFVVVYCCLALFIVVCCCLLIVSGGLLLCVDCRYLAFIARYLSLPFIVCNSLFNPCC